MSKSYINKKPLYPDIPKTFYIYPLGCKTNLSESDMIASALLNKGFVNVSLSEKPGFVIINTCTVTASADKKARQQIRKIKKINTGLKIIVTGCFTVLNRDLLSSLNVDLIIENKVKHLTGNIILQAFFDEQEGKNKNTVKNIQVLEKDISDENLCEQSSYKKHIYSSHSRAFVKIQDGCEQGCSYCIVPLVRGSYASVEPSAVLNHISRLVSCGYEEIVLTGIHIGKYGMDFIKKAAGACSKTASTDIIGDLGGLLDAILKKTLIKRVRLSSIEIGEVNDYLIDTIASANGRIAPHLHIPLQSGSDRVLELMNRNYNTGFFLSSLNKIKNTIPQIALTTDIIAGFPQEYEDDFLNTIKILEEINFSKVHVFKYSRRENTRAAGMDSHLQESVKKFRTARIKETGENLRNKYINKNLDKILEVVCEEYNMADKIAYGTSENYIKVYFKLLPADFKINKRKILKVRTKSIFKKGLYGTII